MNRIVYKSLALLLCAILVLTLMPANVARADNGSGTTPDGFVYSITPANGGTPAYATITGYSGAGGIISIPSAVTDGSISYPVTDIGPQCFNSKAVTSISVPVGVKSIGIEAFIHCVQLTAVTLPNTLKTLGTSCFQESSIQSLLIPGSVDSIGLNAFYRCGSLNTVTFEAGSMLTQIQAGTFCDSAIQSITLPEGVTSIYPGAFKGCARLESVTLPDTLSSLYNPWAGEYGAFQDCTSLGAITIPAGVTQIGCNSFGNCPNLESITFESDNTLTQIMSYAFINCPKLNSVDLPGSLKAIGGAAFANTGLTEIQIPAGINELSSGVFSRCSNLISVTFTENSILETIQNGAFQNCTSLTSIQLPESVRYIKPDAFGYTTALQFISILAGVSEIGSNAFNGNYADGVTSNSALSGAFFFGEPPASIGADAFSNTSNDFSIYYHISKEAAWISFNSYNKAPFVVLMLKLYDQIETTACAPLDTSAHITVPASPSRSGFEFTGWFTDEDRTIPFDAQSTTVTDNMTLFAKWNTAQTANPVITSIGPASGPATGDTSVTLTGTGFTGVTAVKFGQIDAPTFIPVSSSEISATAPAGTAGSSVGVTVTTPYGTSTPAAYTYLIDAVPESSIHAIVNGSITSGWLLKAWSSSKGSGAVASMSAGTQEYTLAGLVPSSDYLIQIVDENGFFLDKEEGISVMDGQSTDITLTPASGAKLQIRIRDNNDVALSGIRIVINDAATGAYISSGYTGTDGRIPDISYLSGRSVTIQALANTRSYHNRTVSGQSLSPGDNPLVLTLQSLPGAVLNGVVLDSNGNAVAGGVVTAMQTVDNRRWTFTAITGSNGTYNMNVLQGDAMMDASAPGGISLRSVKGISVTDITEAGKTQNFQLPRVSQKGEITLRLYTGSNGQNYILQPMDSVVAAHYHIKAAVSADGRIYAGYPLEVYGVPGDAVTVTADGYEAGISSQSVDVTLDADCNAVAEFHLDKIAVATGTVLFGGTNAKTSLWKGVLYRMENGKKQWIQNFTGNGGDFPLSIADPGQYLVEAYEGSYVGSASFSIAGGENKSIGNVTMNRPGLFTGAPGNSMVLQPEQTIVGGTLSVNVSYNKSITGTIDNVNLLLDIPAGTSLVQGSLKVNGQTAQPDISSNGSILTVPLGTLHITEKGFVSYQLKLDEDYTAMGIGLSGQVQYMDVGGSKTETLGADTSEVEQLRLMVSAQRTPVRDITVCGYAPVNRTVTVYDGTTLLGSATAGPNGFWKLTVTLPETGGTPEQHFIMAESDTGTRTVYSPAVALLYDRFEPRLTEVTARQFDGRVYSFDPREGVATSPFVYYPGAPMTFILTFDKPDNVYDVALNFENGGQVSAQFDEVSGKFKAVISPERSPGSVFVTYQTHIGQADWDSLDATKYTEAELRASLPNVLSDYTVDSLDVQNSTIKMTFPQLDNLKVETALSMAAEEYTPTAAERALVKKTGIPVFSLTTGISEENGVTVTTKTVRIPADKEAYEAAMRGDPWFSSLKSVTKIYDTVKDIGTKGYKFYQGSKEIDQLKKGILTGRKLGNKEISNWAGLDNWGKLNAAEAYLNENFNAFSDEDRKMFQKEITSMRTDMALNEVTDSTLDVISVVGGALPSGGTSLLFGVAMGGMLYADNWIKGEKLDTLMNRLNDRVEHKNEMDYIEELPKVRQHVHYTSQSDMHDFF